MIILPPKVVTDTVARAFEQSRTAPDTARLVADALVRAEIDGRRGHGLSRVASYTAQSRSGKVDGHAAPHWEQSAPAVGRIDARSGFAYSAFDLAYAHMPRLAREVGTATCLISRSHHFGVAAHQVERYADAGLVALLFGNTPGAMAAWGSECDRVGAEGWLFPSP
ncbi:MAG: Ldh family oxidoreductase, partial [Planctomycetota bacterium]